MIYTPSDPDHVDPWKPLGERMVRKADGPAERQKPYTDYRPITGQPGWEEDGFGHKRFDGLPAAMERYKRLQTESLQQSMQWLENALDTQLPLFFQSYDASNATPAERACMERLVTDAEIICYGGARDPGKSRFWGQWEAAQRRRNQGMYVGEPEPSRVELLGMEAQGYEEQRTDDSERIMKYVMSNKTATYLNAIAGTTLGVYRGPKDHRGFSATGPLVLYDHTVGSRPLREFLRDARATLPPDVPLWYRPRVPSSPPRMWGAHDL